MIGDDEDDLPDAVQPDPTDDSGVEPKTRTQKGRDEEVLESERKAFWSAALAHRVGRREFWNELADAHFDTTIFGMSPAGFPDSQKTFFELGQQQFGYRRFLTMLKYNREGTLLMLEENDYRLKPVDRPRRRGRRNG